MVPLGLRGEGTEEAGAQLVLLEVTQGLSQCLQLRLLRLASWKERSLSLRSERLDDPEGKSCWGEQGPCEESQASTGSERGRAPGLCLPPSLLPASPHALESPVPKTSYPTKLFLLPPKTTRPFFMSRD